MTSRPVDVFGPVEAITEWAISYGRYRASTMCLCGHTVAFHDDDAGECCACDCPEVEEATDG